MRLSFWEEGYEIVLRGMVYSNVSQTFLLADPFWLRKITTDPHILAHVNIVCPDDGCPKLKTVISALISDSYEFKTVA
jgi:hypothetical protein